MWQGQSQDIGMHNSTKHKMQQVRQAGTYSVSMSRRQGVATYFQWKASHAESCSTGGRTRRRWNGISSGRLAPNLIRETNAVACVLCMTIAGGTTGRPDTSNAGHRRNGVPAGTPSRATDILFCCATRCASRDTVAPVSGVACIWTAGRPTCDSHT